jgi:hypothetical protein
MGSPEDAGRRAVDLGRRNAIGGMAPLGYDTKDRKITSRNLHNPEPRPQAWHQISLLFVILHCRTTARTVASIARGRRWLDELKTGPIANVEAMAKREGCSARKVNMTISLAFLARDLVKATIEGRLPRGMGVARLYDMPAEWSRQHQILGPTSAAARIVEPISLPQSPFPGNGNSRPENRAPSKIQLTGDRDQAFAAHAAILGLFACHREISPNVGLRGGPGRTRTSNQTVMSGRPKIAGVDFLEDLTRSIVFVASRWDRFWCETGAVIAAARIPM